MKLKFYGQIFEKNSYITFHEKLSSRTLVFPCGRTDRQAYEEANIRVLQFYKSA